MAIQGKPSLSGARNLTLFCGKPFSLSVKMLHRISSANINRQYQRGRQFLKVPTIKPESSKIRTISWPFKKEIRLVYYISALLNI